MRVRAAGLLLCTLVMMTALSYSKRISAAPCLPGLPCVTPLTPNAANVPTDGPNKSGASNANKSESEACDADFMNQIYGRAFLEASRETMMTSIIIRKPDSVLEYTCFDQAAKAAADYGGPRFSESTRWQNVNVPNLGGGGGGGLLGFAASILSGFDLEVPGAIGDLIEEANTALGGLELPAGLSLDELKGQLEGLDPVGIKDKLSEIAPEALGQIEQLAQDNIGTLTQGISDAATRTANNAINAAHQQLVDAASGALNKPAAIIEEQFSKAASSALGASAQAATQALGNISTFAAKAEETASLAQTVVNRTSSAYNTAQQTLNQLQAQVNPSQESIAIAEQAVQNAAINLQSAVQAKSEILDRTAALVDKGSELASQLESASSQASAAASAVSDGIESASEAVRLASSVTELTDQINSLGSELNTYAENVPSILGDAIAVGGRLAALGSEITGLIDRIPTSVSDLLSLGGIESSVRTELDAFLGSTSLDFALNRLLGSALKSYADSNFAHTFLGGAIVGDNNSIAAEVAKAGADCNFMNGVYFAARCNDFGLDDPFLTFSVLAGQDFRLLPQTCNKPMFTTQDIEVAYNTGFKHVAFDRAQSFESYFDASTCEPPIPTGVKVTQREFSIDISGNMNLINTKVFDDMICVNPGCYFDQGTCKVKP